MLIPLPLPQTHRVSSNKFKKEKCDFSPSFQKRIRRVEKMDILDLGDYTDF